jgi:hypothetical protein
MRADILWTIIASIPGLVYLSLQLLFIYLSWGRHIRKARRACEAQLVMQGLSKDQARAMSQIYIEMKNDIQRSLWSFVQRKSPKKI